MVIELVEELTLHFRTIKENTGCMLLGRNKLQGIISRSRIMKAFSNKDSR